MADLEYSVDEGVATILLNRPERRNAFTLEMIDTWASLLVEAEANRDTRVIVVTGSDGTFCSGVDLSEYKAEKRGPLEEKELLTRHVHRVALALEDVSKPVIAAVDGSAVGAGMDMALLCDIRFASRSDRTSAVGRQIRVWSRAFLQVTGLPGGLRPDFV